MAPTRPTSPQPVSSWPSLSSATSPQAVSGRASRGLHRREASMALTRSCTTITAASTAITKMKRVAIRDASRTLALGVMSSIESGSHPTTARLRGVLPQAPLHRQAHPERHRRDLQAPQAAQDAPMTHRLQATLQTARAKSPCSRRRRATPRTGGQAQQAPLRIQRHAPVRVEAGRARASEISGREPHLGARLRQVRQRPRKRLRGRQDSQARPLKAKRARGDAPVSGRHHHKRQSPSGHCAQASRTAHLRRDTATASYEADGMDRECIERES